MVCKAALSRPIGVVGISVWASAAVLLLLFLQRRNDALALFFDVPGEAGTFLLDKAGGQAEFQQGDGKGRGEVVEVGAGLGKLDHFNGFVEELLHCLVQFIIEKLGHADSHVRVNPYSNAQYGLHARTTIRRRYNTALGKPANVPVRKIMRALVALMAMACALSVAHAQNYPSRVVRIVVPIAAGGATDILSRTIAQRLHESWGQVVQVDNRPGASGIIGSEIVAKSPPDGHTLLMAFTSHVTNPSLQPRLPYDTLNDFAPVSMIAVVPSVLLVHPSLPVRSVRELIAFAKPRPGELNYGSSGTGTATHLAALLFSSMTGVIIEHVPYRGGAPAFYDLLSGRVSLMFGNMAVRHAAHPFGPAARTGGDQSRTIPRAAAVADDGGSRAARIRGDGVVCIACARQDVRHRDQQAQCRGRGGFAAAGYQGTAGSAGRGSQAEQSCRARRSTSGPRWRSGAKSSGKWA